LKRLLITGTDTGAGKTTFSCALLQLAPAAKVVLRAMKPIASGADWGIAGWQNDDALKLLAAQNLPLARYSWVNPYCFAEAIAPHLAQQQSNVSVKLPLIRESYEALAQGAELMLVEGAGGFLSPLATLEGGKLLEHAELARALGISDVLLVVGLKLGCINHARLSELAINAAGLRCIGVVLSVLDAKMPALQGNIDTLKNVLSAPMLAVFDAHAPQPLAGVLDLIMPKLQDEC
jgi:dethiobiotin synthetase